MNGYRTFSYWSSSTAVYNWYYPHNQTLHARLFLKQKGKLDTRGTRTADWQDNSAINDSTADEVQQSSKKFPLRHRAQVCRALCGAPVPGGPTSYVRSAT